MQADTKAFDGSIKLSDEVRRHREGRLWQMGNDINLNGELLCGALA